MNIQRYEDHSGQQPLHYLGISMEHSASPQKAWNVEHNSTGIMPLYKQTTQLATLWLVCQDFSLVT